MLWCALGGVQGFSIQPPTVPISTNEEGQNKDVGTWDGLSNSAWGSYLYYTTVARANSRITRPIALTRDAQTNWRDDEDPHMGDEVPGHHRYPMHVLPNRPRSHHCRPTHPTPNGCL